MISMFDERVIEMLGAILPSFPWLFCGMQAFHDAHTIVVMKGPLYSFQKFNYSTRTNLIAQCR